MEIAGAIAHALDPPLLFSPNQQVAKLEAILVEIQGYLAEQEKVHEEVQEVHEASDAKEHQDDQRR